MTPSSSAMDWFVPCSVNDTRNIFLYYSIFFKCTFMFLFRVHVSHPCVAVENMYVRIIRNFILLFVAFHSFSMSINLLHAIACLCCTRNNTNWSLCQITIISFFYNNNNNTVYSLHAISPKARSTKISPLQAWLQIMYRNIVATHYCKTLLQIQNIDITLQKDPLIQQHR